MSRPGHRIGACFGKAALKTHALQTLRDCRASPNRAKRLECVRFIGAFRPARDGPRFMVPMHAKHRTSNIEPPSCAGMGHRALPGNDSWTLSAREKCSRLSEGVFCPFWSHLRDTLSIIWDRPNSIRGLFRTIAGVFVESDCGTSFANSKDAVAKGNS